MTYFAMVVKAYCSNFTRYIEAYKNDLITVKRYETKATT